ncbi:hypothetical protein GCM10022276_04790 [Sphingomonas limnosediminicola]|uniref:Uncharacterized protein n=1 Tax=Sphingomonas limnosediminicola TaxID=940133 RepID=A0ABP7KZ90_9SPHN
MLHRDSRARKRASQTYPQLANRVCLLSGALARNLLSDMERLGYGVAALRLFAFV